MIKWISEAEALPRVAQKVFLARPGQFNVFWDIVVAQILIQHEDVSPMPVKAGNRWPTTYWWSWGGESRCQSLVTGNAWWASMSEINLPPGAEHEVERGYQYIKQTSRVFVGQGK